MQNDAVFRNAKNATRDFLIQIASTDQNEKTKSEIIFFEIGMNLGNLESTVVLAAEGENSEEQRVKNDANRPAVRRLSIILFSAHNLKKMFSFFKHSWSFQNLKLKFRKTKTSGAM